MWCWHRIRESESGLCPACRTPYGDDPHEFSAVDVEEVLKANKEKEAAAKRERDRQRQQNDGNLSDGEGVHTIISGNAKGQMEVPKDRSQLANMRVIRRNLVYAVGLPPSIASEDTLRKADYFGQYGKISKIVLNRNQTTGGDLRRASASAYVTFVHKEDTLACILALDGFYLEGRNIRASYGTSKYCSAFIKNVRCNNPECTYLHQMGDVEDTFTKQEIQAGYVTSGRDVLARQQQIVQQALSAASGAAGSAPRRRIGGGGPSGTGKASSNPQFPPPSFDEPAKPSTTAFVPPPPPPAAASVRSATTGSGFPTIAAANASSAPIAQSGMPRSSSSGAMSTGSTGSFGPTPKGSIGSAAQVARKGLIGGPALNSSGAGAVGATAASVVAGVHSISGSSEPPAPHTTLTPLTPLKRGTGSKGAKPSAAGDDQKGLNSRQNTDTGPRLTSLRTSNGKKTNGLRSNPPGPPSNDIALNRNQAPGRPDGIGGSVIAAPMAVAPPVIGSVGSINQIQSAPSPLAELGGQALGGLGGEVFDGPLQSVGPKSAIGAGAPIGSGKRNQGSIRGDPVLPGSAGGLWASGVNGSGPSFASSGGDGIMGTTIGTIGGGGGSSALASMLGINLPTGSGSLRESSSLWGTPGEQAPISSLNGNSFPMQGVIGSGPSNPSNGLIGGVTIGGGHAPMGAGTIGGGGNKSDIALLQSLLPGVHITSGGGYNHGNGFGAIGGVSGGNDWNHAGGNQSQQNAPGGNLGYREPRQQQWNGGLQSSLGGAPVGAIGQTAGKQGQRQAPGNIW